ncbi:hypothetical protein SDC9_99566 [bioreactor metagenome]|uniref:Uncharacterized protein n=1 Tax=bioreactor metagenome TaxID=1076179 RepID=A0A645APJ8_9ZZZZ
MIPPKSSSIGTIKAVLLTERIVAIRYMTFAVSINGFGLNCNVLSRFLYAVPLISGFSFEQKFANECIAARVISISYMLSGALLNTGVYPFSILKYPSASMFALGFRKIVSKIPMYITPHFVAFRRSRYNTFVAPSARRSRKRTRRSAPAVQS